MPSSKKTYKAENIEVLEGLEAVRKRPGMYIAGTDTPEGLHQLIFEILDNSVDEAMNGHAKEIEVVLHKDGTSASIHDDGRGIPVDKHPKYKKSALELILTTLHAGGKFSDDNYQTAGGLHGVGSSVVNALSSEMQVTVYRDGSEYNQAYERGKVKSKLKSSKLKKKRTGTSIFFRPDDKIFPSIKFSNKRLRQVIQTKAYLNPGLSLSFKDETTGNKENFCYEAGLSEWLKNTVEAGKPKLVGDQFSIEKDEEFPVRLAFCWTDTTKEDFRSYVNGIHTPDGGSHENGARAGIVKAVKNYLNVHDLIPKGVKIGSEDIREGLLCFVSVLLPGNKYQAQFQGQTKSKLNNPEVAPIVEAAAKAFEQTLNENPSTANLISQRIIMAAKARAASRAAGQSVRRKVGLSHRLTLPGKLADCSTSKPAEAELFIVEGESAGGSTKQGRAREYQAVLPLRGKVLNTVTSNRKKIMENKELGNVVSALGCGVAEDLKIEKLRYDKVIILTDADADGMHIATLLLAFFHSYMKELIEHGKLYLGMPPLFGIFPKGGKKPIWAYSEKERDQATAKLKSPRIVRYKGLGEMNPDTLWETTLDPERRTLLRVTTEDFFEAESHFEGLMGSDPSTRGQLIREYASLTEVDI